MTLSIMLLFPENGDMFEIVISTMWVFPWKYHTLWRKTSAWRTCPTSNSITIPNVCWLFWSHDFNMDVNNVSISWEIPYIMNNTICGTPADLSKSIGIPCVFWLCWSHDIKKVKTAGDHLQNRACHGWRQTQCTKIQVTYTLFKPTRTLMLKHWHGKNCNVDIGRLWGIPKAVKN